MLSLACSPRALASPQHHEEHNKTHVTHTVKDTRRVGVRVHWMDVFMYISCCVTAALLRFPYFFENLIFYSNYLKYDLTLRKSLQEKVITSLIQHIFKQR